MEMAAFRDGYKENAEAQVKLSLAIEAIVKAEDVDFLSESAFADACRPGNPKDTSVADMWYFCC